MIPQFQNAKYFKTSIYFLLPLDSVFALVDKEREPLSYYFCFLFFPLFEDCMFYCTISVRKVDNGRKKKKKTTLASGMNQ